MGDYIQPTITGDLYNPAKCVAIRDRYQQYQYISRGAYPKDIYTVGHDLVMVFDKAETRDMYELWRKHEL